MHIAKRVFEQIIECSDVGLEPDMEEGMKEIKAFGLQLGEAEDDTEYVVKVSLKSLVRFFLDKGCHKQLIKFQNVSV